MKGSMMQTLKTMAVALTLLATGFHVTVADDAVWRSSQPLRIRSINNSAQTASTAQSVWEQIEYPLLVQRLRAEIAQARADVEFWELRTKNYERLRFTDAAQTAIRHAENALLASRRDEAEAARKLSLVRRHRVALGELRTQMLSRGRVNSPLELDR